MVNENLGWDKSTPIAVLRQAKIYPAGKLPLPQSTSRNPRDWNAIWPIAALQQANKYAIAAIRELNYILRGLRQYAHCGSAAKGNAAPQFEHFYTVPENFAVEYLFFCRY